MVAHAADELRGSVWALRTMPVEGRSFTESLEAVARQAGHGHATRISVRSDGTPFEVPQFVAGNLLLVAQEAIHNALRHAAAPNIDVVGTFDASSHAIDLRISDDGAGFTPGLQVGPDQGHFGLSGMRERIDRLGGSFSIESRPGAGTTVRATARRRDYDMRIDVENGGGRADVAVEEKA
jgi:signal transduction histidine kinase